MPPVAVTLTEPVEVPAHAAPVGVAVAFNKVGAVMVKEVLDTHPEALVTDTL